jgi:putative transposase
LQLYREKELGVRKRKGRKRANGVRVPILEEAGPNARWSLDFVYDQIANVRCFRILNVVNGLTRECLVSNPDTQFPINGWPGSSWPLTSRKVS